MKIRSLLGRVRPRHAAAEALQLAGFAALVAGAWRLAGLGVALVVAGLLVVLLAFEVER